MFGQFEFAAMSETRHDELFATCLALPEVQRNTTRPDLVRDVLRQRGRYVSAALTIVRWPVAPSRNASHWPVLVTGLSAPIES